MDKLTYQQEDFCRQFILDLNATQAAIRAGYSKRTATPSASRLLTSVNVQERIRELQAARSLETKVTAERVLLELARMGFSNMKNFINPFDDEVKNIHDLDDNHSACISEINDTVTSIDGVTTRKRKIKLYDKTSALEKIARHIGFFEKDNDQTSRVIQVTFGKK